MISEGQFEEIKRFLPQFLSAEAQRDLFRSILQFPDNLNSRMYSSALLRETEFLQGDGVKSMPFVLLPRTDFGRQPAIILSNSCDLSLDNSRLLDLRVNYAPIHKLEKYENLLRNQKPRDSNRIASHLAAIRRQEVSHLFYLPDGPGGPGYEGLVRLDTIQNASLGELSANRIPQDRLFTFSNYGQYLFLVKLSIHLTRIRDGVDRH